MDSGGTRRCSRSIEASWPGVRVLREIAVTLRQTGSRFMKKAARAQPYASGSRHSTAAWRLRPSGISPSFAPTTRSTRRPSFDVVKCANLIEQREVHRHKTRGAHRGVGVAGGVEVRREEVIIG